MSITENSGYCINQGETYSSGSGLGILGKKNHYYDIECNFSGTTGGYLRWESLNYGSSVNNYLYIPSDSHSNITATLVLYTAGRYISTITDNSYYPIFFAQLYAYTSSYSDRTDVYLNAACTRKAQLNTVYNGRRLYCPAGKNYIYFNGWYKGATGRLYDYYNSSDQTYDSRIPSQSTISSYLSGFQALYPSGNVWTSTSPSSGLGAYYAYCYDSSWSLTYGKTTDSKEIPFHCAGAVQTQAYN